jgi:ABC-2 type transport system ATP-binding protein
MIGSSPVEKPVLATGIVKRYGRRTVLDHVSLAVEPGITGLVGPHGAGKSTRGKAILGLVRLAEGSVAVFGLDPRREPHRVRREVGVVPEDECAVPGLSGVEMVRYAARLSGIPGIESLRRAHEVLDWCDAGQERYRPVETLSVGMRQKISFAAAIVHDPRMVILDEPTNGLDPIERRAMLGRLTTLARDHGKTILVSTHVLPDVQSICERVIVLAGGRVRLSGSIRQLTHPAVPEEQLEVIGPVDELVGRLVARGIPARRAVALDLRAAVAGSATEGTVLLQVNSPEALAAMWAEVGALGVRVRSLKSSRRPFEEVFLEALRSTDAPPTEPLHAAP